MSTTINASTSSGLVQTADTSGILELQSNGTTQLTVASTGVYGALKSSVAQTASGTAVNFLDIPSWVKRITVMFNGVSTSGASIVQIQVGDSGGIKTTGYNSTGISQSNGGVVLSSSVNGFIVSGNVAATQTHSGIATLCNLGSNVWVFNSLAKQATNQNAYAGGDFTGTGTLDRIRITTVNGTDTFDAGTINIMYEG